MATLPTFTSIDEVENALKDFGFKLKRIDHLPSKDEINDKKTVYFTSNEKIKKQYPNKLTFPRYLGTLTYCQSSYDFYPDTFTKVQLRKWTSSSSSSDTMDCPICCVPMNLWNRKNVKKRGCSSCGRCGFRECVVCVLKESLKLQRDINDIVCWKCPNCREFAKLNLKEFSASIIRDGHLKKFDKSQQNEIKSLAVKSRLYNHYLKESKNVPTMKCCNCTRTFINKRYRCNGCKKVCYCTQKCQRENWKYAHKEWCRMFKLIKDHNNK